MSDRGSKNCIYLSGYLTFGGFDLDDVVTDDVFLVHVDRWNNVTTACNHSILPSTLKESHVYEYQDTLLVCSSFRSTSDETRLDCYIWNATESAWQDFDTPAKEGNVGIQGFIQSVKIPDVGIWFTSFKDDGDSSYMLVSFCYIF